MTTQKIYQLQVSYTQAEDRLMLRFNTIAGIEYRFWLTRLFITKFWPILINTLKSNVAATHPDAQEGMLGFMQQALAEQADFTSEFVPPKAPSPYAEKPMLVCRAQLQPKGEGLHTLSLYPETGHGVELGVDQNLMLLLGRLIVNTVSQIDWGVAIALPGADIGNSSQPDLEQKEARRLLN